MDQFFSDRSASSSDLVVDLDPADPQLGAGAVPGAPSCVPRTEVTGVIVTSAPVLGPSAVASGAYGAAGLSGPPPAAPSGYGFVPPFGDFTVPRAPYVPGPGQLYAHGSPGLAAAYMSPSTYGVGMLPFTSRPRMSVAPEMLFPQPAFQPYGNVQDILARRAHLDHALASMVSLLFLYYYSILWVLRLPFVLHLCLPDLDVTIIYFAVVPDTDIFLYKC